MGFNKLAGYSLWIQIYFILVLIYFVPEDLWSQQFLQISSSDALVLAWWALDPSNLVLQALQVLIQLTHSHWQWQTANFKNVFLFFCKTKFKVHCSNRYSKFQIKSVFAVTFWKIWNASDFFHVIIRIHRN